MSALRVLSIVFVLSASLHAAEHGDPSKLALRFNDATGNLTEIVYKGETVTLPQEPGAVLPGQTFDISLDGQWQYGKHPVELVSMGKEKGPGSGNVFNVTQKFGDWTLTFRYTVDQKTATLGRSVMMFYLGKEPAKIKGFWFSYPVFPFEKDAKFIVPGLYPPKVFTPDNFTDGAKQGIWRNSAPFAMQLDEKKSVIMMQDTLIDYADRGGADASHRDGGIRLAQSFTTQGHVRPGSQLMIGVGYLRFVDGDVETALLKIHDLMKYLGHVVPEDRPKWFEEAITYSFHPGGTIGSQCTDLGGFVPATKHLDRIKELGCNSIWFMPLEDKSIYWPRDYYKFQDGLGSTPEKAGEEYKALVDRAHELGMKVLQDSVPHGGSNTYQRMIDHPEWLAQEEDGSTLHYWCADFNWPTWIDYMAGVSTHYVKTYGIDGFRVDACGGSKIPNWNPAIPYARASHSQSQGGLNMLRAIRKAVKDEKPDGAILAEVQGSVFGAVSDAVYDFELAYNVLHDARKQTPEEFVKRLRRWLHEQQYSEIPDLLRLRHVESHDSLRAQLWYGTEPHRALMALTTFIHGIPLVYHEQETGHWASFIKMFATRRALPELNGGDADYRCIDAPPGVFACLRTKGDDASIVLINFNDDSVFRYTVEMPWNRLPEKLRQGDRLWVTPEHDGLLFGGGNYTVEKTGDRLRIAPVEDEKWDPENPTLADAIHLSPFEWKVVVLRRTEEAIVTSAQDIWNEKYRYVSGKKDLKYIEEERKKIDDEQLQNLPETENTFLLTEDTTSVNKDIAYISKETGLLVRLEVHSENARKEKRVEHRFGEAELLLPEEWKSRAEKPVVTQTETGILVRQSFGPDSTLEIRYSTAKNSKAMRSGRYKSGQWLEIDCRWVGENVPKSSAMAIPAIDADSWWIEEDSVSSMMRDKVRLRHQPTPDGVYGSIYWRPQGTSTIYDSLLFPFTPDRHSQWLNATVLFGSGAYGTHVGSLDTAPTRFRFVDRLGERQGLFMLVSITDESVPQLSMKPECTFQIGRWSIDYDKEKNESNLRPTTGGWIFENEYYRLRLTRSGTVMSLENKNDAKSRMRSGAELPGETAEMGQSGSSAEYRSASGSLIQGGDIYTDYGYGKEKTKYAASFDVETGIRIVQDEDGTLRLRFEGQLRGFYRFDLMRPPVEYFTEYALSEKSPAFSMACGVKTNRSATDDRAFLALMLPMPEVERFVYFKDGKPMAEGTNVDAKGRSFQCRDGLPDRVLLKDGKENLLELTGLEGEASNLFLDRKNFFITFDDGENLGAPGRWRSFTATVSASTARSSLEDRSSQDNVPKVTASCDLRSRTNQGLLVDGGFEAVASNDLVSLRTGAVLKGPRGHATGWQMPPQGSVVSDVFHGGKSAARVVGETAQYRHFEQDVAAKNLKPGQKLRLSAWVKGDDLKQGPESWQIGSVRFVAQVDGKIQYSSAPALLGTFDWKEVSTEFTVPEKLQRLSVQVGVNGAAGTIWIDDAAVTPL